MECKANPLQTVSLLIMYSVLPVKTKEGDIQINVSWEE